MSFIGVIAENKEFEKLKMEMQKSDMIKNNHIVLLHDDTIENVQNVKFETIIFMSQMEMQKEKFLTKLCEEAKYVLVNCDLPIALDFLTGKKVNLITFGLHPKATVTVSSITEETLLLSLQRSITNKKGILVEVEEKRFPFHQGRKVYEALIYYVLTLIYE